MNNLIARISLPWTFSRFLYLGLGGIILFQAIADQLWLGAIMGGYFIAMGLFAWGCASGDCAVPQNKYEQRG